jgi:release factor glutamine methyltransferase
MSDPPLVDVLVRTERWLRGKGIPSPRLEAELLLAKVLGTTRLQLYLQHDRPLSSPELDALRPLVARRGKREPLAWILGSQGFHAIDLDVHPNVLVARPDTEVLVDAALEWLPKDERFHLADVGCGTGAVGLAIAVARPEARIYAVDQSKAALANTRANVLRLGLEARVAVLEGDLLGPIPSTRPVEWVVSNPPYIKTGDIAALEPEVSRHEPKLALDGGPDGLAVYRKLVPMAWRRDALGILLEVGAGQAGQVAEITSRAGWTGVTTWNDLAGIPRVVGGRRR